MRAWVIKTGEPLPCDDGARPMRAWRISEALAAAGHDVTWWSATFDHQHKRHRARANAVHQVARNLQLELIHSPGYQRNVSVRRFVDHRILARRFAAAMREAPRPDLIVASLPTLEVAEEAIRFARRHDIPVVVDVRDLWPDVFLDVAPRRLRPLARVALTTEFARMRRIARNATAITAISDDYLAWGLRNAGRPATAADAVFPIGYELSDASGDASVDFGIPEHVTVAAFVGSFGMNYDLATVIRAARLMERQGRRDVAFVLAGDGERGDAWRAEARGLTNIVFPGWLSAAQIRGLLRRASIGLVAYRAGAPQSLPNKPFEYMAGGVALVSSLRGELTRLIDTERIGVNYAPEDPGSLAGALSSLLDEPEALTAMGTRARTLLASRFDVRNVYPQMVEHLERVAATTRGGTARARAHDGSARAVG